MSREWTRNSAKVFIEFEIQNFIKQAPLLLHKKLDEKLREMLHEKSSCELLNAVVFLQFGGHSLAVDRFS